LTPPLTDSPVVKLGVVREPKQNENAVVIFNLALRTAKRRILLLMPPYGLLHPIKKTAKNSARKLLLRFNPVICSVKFGSKNPPI
jgi:hypothetical protein